MNKKLINFIITIILAGAFSLFMPWWSIMIAALVSSLLISLKKSAVFFIPFFAIFLFWSVYCYMLSSTNNFILAKRIAVLFDIGGNPYLLIVVTGIIGGIAAGVSGVLGKQLNSILKS